MGKSNLRNPRTLNPHEQWWFHSTISYRKKWPFSEIKIRPIDLLTNVIWAILLTLLNESKKLKLNYKDNSLKGLEFLFLVLVFFCCLITVLVYVTMMFSTSVLISCYRIKGNIHPVLFFFPFAPIVRGRILNISIF